MTVSSPHLCGCLLCPVCLCGYLLCPVCLCGCLLCPLCVGAFCVFSVPGPVVPYMLFHISPCPLCASGISHCVPSVTHNSMSQKEHSVPVSLCVPMTSKSPVLLLQCLPRSLCVLGFCIVCPFKVSPLPMGSQGFRSWLQEGLSCRCDGVLLQGPSHAWASFGFYR